MSDELLKIAGYVAAIFVGLGMALPQLKPGLKKVSAIAAQVVPPPDSGHEPAWMALDGVRESQNTLTGTVSTLADSVNTLADSVNDGFRDVRERLGQQAEHLSRLDWRMDTFELEISSQLGALGQSVKMLHEDQEKYRDRLEKVERKVANLEHAKGFTPRADSGSAHQAVPPEVSRG